MSLTYRDVQTYVHSGLQALGYVDAPIPGNRAMPAFAPGPATVARLQNISAGAIVFLQVGGGPGLSLEGVYDGIFISVLTIGTQGDHDNGERLALDVDEILCGGVGGTTQMGATRTLYTTRTGGRPSLTDMDNGERYHFVCSYVTEAPSETVR